MKHLITITLLLFSFCSFGQVVDTTQPLRYDTKIWVHGTKPQAFNADSIRKKNPAAYNTLMKLMDRDTIPICQHIYVAVEQPEVNGGFSTLSIGRFGKHEGKEIVCIKCHHLRKQIVDYGQTGQLQLGPRFTLEVRDDDNVDPPKKQ